MKSRENILEFSGLPLGDHEFEYELSETFFSSFDLLKYERIQPLIVKVKLNKSNHMMEMKLSFRGFMNTFCDVSNDPFTLEISNNFSLIVKFGESFNDENPEILILPRGEFEINMKQLFYELIALSIPIQKIKKDTEIKKDKA
ncbi:MAG: YceD family protein [Schleiferiaceae bacterium]|jgi:uncharacterized metal-binding protein YceD (DUF177 family)|nr:MAG: hypothetical protein CBB74_07180 [Owenweeksia sp. TMED14]|tara:strand:- start:30800 stop:31228 length:429 start_codon:yes stop_codon:yes gene_type:complete